MNKCLFRADSKESSVGARRISIGTESQSVGAATLKALSPPAGAGDGEETHIQRPHAPRWGTFMEEV